MRDHLRMPVVAASLDRSPTRRDAQRLETRQRLFDAAVAEFHDRGYAGTDIGSIAKSVGVTRGTFYFHFPTKEHVLAELELLEERRIASHLASMLRGSAGLGDMFTAVINGVVGAERRLGADLLRDMCALHFQPSMAVGDDVEDHPLAAVLVEAIEQATQRGDLDPRTNAAEMATIFLTGVFGLLATSQGSARLRSRLLKQFCSMTINGMRTP